MCFLLFTDTDRFDLYRSMWKFGGGSWAPVALRGRERPVSSDGADSVVWSLAGMPSLVLTWHSIGPLAWDFVLVLNVFWALALLIESLSS